MTELKNSLFPFSRRLMQKDMKLGTRMQAPNKTPWPCIKAKHSLLPSNPHKLFFKLFTRNISHVITPNNSSGVV